MCFKTESHDKNNDYLRPKSRIFVIFIFKICFSLVCCSATNFNNKIPSPCKTGNNLDNTTTKKIHSLHPSLKNKICITRGGGKLPENVISTKNKNKSKEPSSPSFDKVLFFPIYKSELRQFLRMSLLMFLCIYIYTNVRDTKDTLIVSNCGAESIPFLKLYGVMPSATVFILVYSNLSNILSRDQLFYVTLIPFFVFYSLFAFVLYPMRDRIHVFFIDVPNISYLKASALSLLRYWSFSLYYIVSELWASVGVPLFFWQCANDVTSINQAKRFYPLFAVLGNLAPIASGQIMSHVVSKQKIADDVGFGNVLRILTVIQLCAGLGICCIYRAVYSNLKELNISQNPTIVATKSNAQTNKSTKKKNPTLSESIVELSKCQELASIATMVIGYNICIELTEVLWKGILKKTFTNKSTYMTFLAKLSQIIGISAICLQLCSSEIIRRLGWRNASLITPLTMGTLAIPFFASVAYTIRKNGKNSPLSSSDLFIPLIIGTTQTVISKVTKYSLFDPCKEMAYIPLGPEAKIKGKAAVDVLGSRLGRSLGNASQQFLVVLLGGTILRCAPQLGILYILAVILWSRAVLTLGKLFEEHNRETS